MRALGVLLAVIVGTVAVPAPASAAGEQCATTAHVRRCAEMSTVATDDTNFYASMVVESLRYPRIKVRYVWVAMQRRTDAGWVRVARNVNQSGDRFRSVSTAAARPCADSRRGVYRSRALVEWKVRGEDGVRTALVTSSGVRKSRLC